MAKTSTVTLGEKQFTIRELPTKPAEAWRKRLGDELAPLMDLVGQAPGMAKMELNADTLPALVGQFKAIAFGSLPTVREMVFGYAPALEQDREWLEGNACDSEFIDAFVECVKLAFPFGSLVPMVQRVVKLGQGKAPTLQS